MVYFIYNGIDSRQYNMILTKTPNRIRPPRIYTEQVAYGGDGSIITPLGYGSYDMSLNVGIADTTYIDEICAWLNGSGELTISDDPGKYMNVHFLEQINFEKLMKFKTASITVRCQPFRYKVNDNVYSTSNKTFTVTNAGNYVSRPCITILGTGTCSVSVNGNKIFDVSELPITIDSLSFESYYNGINKNRKKTGGYIELNPGSSKIEVTGDNVGNIEMRRCDRWL